MKRFLWIAVGSVALAACGGPGSFSGSVGGNKLGVKEAVALKVSLNLGNVAVPLPVLILSDQTHLCDNIKNKVEVKNSTSFAMILAASDANGKLTAPTAAGSYAINPTAAVQIFLQLNPPKSQTFAEAQFEKLDASCKDVYAGTNNSNGASTGTIKVDSLNLAAGGMTTGSFTDLVFTSGDKATGSFAAVYCDANPSLDVTNPLGVRGSSPTCQ